MRIKVFKGFTKQEAESKSVEWQGSFKNVRVINAYTVTLGDIAKNFGTPHWASYVLFDELAKRPSKPSFADIE
jgi:hypothetical protein